MFALSFLSAAIVVVVVAVVFLLFTSLLLPIGSPFSDSAAARHFTELVGGSGLWEIVSRIMVSAYTYA